MAQQERIELRFSPGNPDERALITALEAQGEAYGARGRFLKARLVKGYYAIMKEVDVIRQESDPLAALDHLAQSVNSGHYRVLRALLTDPAPAAAAAPAADASAALAGALHAALQGGR